jgi:hypothetical protein
MTLADRIRHPALIVALILVAFVLGAAFAGGTAGWLMQGGLAIAVKAPIAAAIYWAVIRGTRWLRLNFDTEANNALLGGNAVALAVLHGLGRVAAALVVLAVFI